MATEEPVASRVMRSVVRRAIGDAAYRQTLLASPNGVMRFELARAGGPVPDITFDAVEETENTWVLRVPVSQSERRAQDVLRPVFEFVDSASKDERDRFVRAPRGKLEKLLGLELDQDMDIVVRIESEGERVLVIPLDEFSLIGSKDLPVSDARIKLCPKGHTLCPKDVTVDACPADCTFTRSCDCTFSSTDTGMFCTIQQGPWLSGSREESLKRLSDLLDG